MKWPWKRRSPSPTIPPYTVPVAKPKPRQEAMVVEEHDTTDMTKTGVQRAWDRLSGKFK